MQQSFYTVFWFAAESLDSLQNWYNKASFCIAPGRFGEFSRHHYRAVTQWLLDPANGKWILIFDNANPELNFGDILPEKVPWGKTLFTSRSEDIKVGTKWLSDPLFSFQCRCFQQKKRSHCSCYDAQTWSLRKDRDWKCPGCVRPCDTTL